MQKNKHRWTFDVDKICCEKFVERYVVDQSDMDITSFVRLLQQELPDIQSTSLKMKIQNIKQIVLEIGIKDTLASKPLSNYSLQNQKAMTAVLQEHGIR